jgi:hypothetical protein
MSHDIVEFINLFFAGILAGMEAVIHYALTGATEMLDEEPQIKLRQALILRLRWLVPAFFVPTVITAVAVTISEHAKPGIAFRYAGLLAIFIWILVRVVGTVRINSATLEWKANDPPKDWKEQIANSERFHMIGTWAAVMVFVFFSIAAGLRLN